ncbi:hypothetical protein STEG23_007376 [Scotinomys teguina]
MSLIPNSSSIPEGTLIDKRSYPARKSHDKTHYQALLKRNSDSSVSGRKTCGGEKKKTEEGPGVLTFKGRHEHGHTGLSVCSTHALQIMMLRCALNETM